MLRQSLSVGLVAMLALSSGAAHAEMAKPAVTAQTETGTIVDIAVKNDSFKTLVAALKAAGLVETLSGKGPFTVFAPTDAAFAKLPAGTLETLLKPENKETLVKILTYHVLPAEVLSSAIQTGEAKTVEGSTVKVTLDASKKEVMVNGAKVVAADVKGSNGVIHVIDAVILPPSVKL